MDIFSTNQQKRIPMKFFCFLSQLMTLLVLFGAWAVGSKYRSNILFIGVWRNNIRELLCLLWNTGAQKFSRCTVQPAGCDEKHENKLLCITKIADQLHLWLFCMTCCNIINFCLSLFYQAFSLVSTIASWVVYQALISEPISILCGSSPINFSSERISTCSPGVLKLTTQQVTLATLYLCTYQFLPFSSGLPGIKPFQSCSLDKIGTLNFAIFLIKFVNQVTLIDKMSWHTMLVLIMGLQLP